MEKLSKNELLELIKSVFPHFKGDKKLGILVDIPNSKEKDNEDWSIRRNR